VFPGISKKTPCGNSRLRIIHIGNTITYKNQVFPICGNLGILVQQLLARKHSGVGIRSAFNLLLNCVFNGFGTGCKIRKRSGHVCLLVEDHNADLDLCSRFCRLLFQRSKHTQRLFFLLCARGLIQHEYHIRCQLFLRAGQRQGHIGGPGVRIQLRCGLGSGNVPLNRVGAAAAALGAAGGFFRSRLERNSVRIVFYQDVFVSRFRRPTADILKAALTIISRSIPFIPVMIPTGNLRLVGGQNAVAAHVLCIRERKGRFAEEKQVVACGRCGVVVHCAVCRDVDIGRTRVDTAAVAGCDVVAQYAVRRDIDVRAIGVDTTAVGSVIV